MCPTTVIAVLLAPEAKDADFHEAPVDPEREGRFTRSADAERIRSTAGAIR
jgi:hypothetical protein